MQFLGKDAWLLHRLTARIRQAFTTIGPTISPPWHLARVLRVSCPFSVTFHTPSQLAHVGVK